METAIIVPVESVELPLSAAATALGFDRPSGMPAHVTMLHPFVDSKVLVVGHAHQVQRALSVIQPFEASFSSIGRFDDPPVAVYLEPQPDEPFRTMIEALTGTFPQFPPYGGSFADVVPHLTLAETPDRNMWARVEEWFQPKLPLQAYVQRFSIYAETETGWVERFQLPLGELPPEGDVDDSAMLL